MAGQRARKQRHVCNLSALARTIVRLNAPVIESSRPARRLVRTSRALPGCGERLRHQSRLVRAGGVALRAGRRSRAVAPCRTSHRVRLRVDAAIGPALPGRATLMARTLRDAPALHAVRSGKRDTKIRPRRQGAEGALPSPISAHGDQLIAAKPRGIARFLSDFICDALEKTLSLGRRDSNLCILESEFATTLSPGGGTRTCASHSSIE